MIHIILPWYPRELKVNGNKHHWGAIKKAKDAYKLDAKIACMQYNGTQLPKQNTHIEIIFHPARRGSDLDNNLASIKIGLDVIAKTLGIDDKYFRPITLDFGEPDKDNPHIEIKINKVLAEN